ncbi:hypothetical protein HID58_087849, partial [Brassica napus]
SVTHQRKREKENLCKKFRFVFTSSSSTLKIFPVKHPAKISTESSTGDRVRESNPRREREMSKRIPLNLKIILYMLYFSTLSSSSSASTSLSTPHRPTPKPWPILPSYLPWTPPQKNLPARSCEGYFGNGFTRRVDFLKPRISKEGSWNEEAEFQEGAFEVAEDVSFKKRNRRMLNEYVQEGGIDTHTMRDLVASIRIVGTEDFVLGGGTNSARHEIRVCQYVPYRDRLVQRLSVSSRVTGLPNRPHVVFIDGHCTVCSSSCSYSVSFTQNHHAKKKHGQLCSPGSDTLRTSVNRFVSVTRFFHHWDTKPLLSKACPKRFTAKENHQLSLWQNPNVKKTARLSEFGEMIRSAFGFTVNRHRSSETSSSSSPLHNVLFVRREDYLAHPRHDGKVQPLLINEEEVFESLHHWVASGSTGINLVNGLFAHMSMKDQVRAIQDASVIIGAHGAGLTHIVSATPNTTIFEIVSVEF